MNPIITDPTAMQQLLPSAALEILRERFAEIAATAFSADENAAVLPEVQFESPRRVEFGDFSTNIAFSLAKAARKPPAAIAQILVDKAKADGVVTAIATDIEAVAGFINFRLVPARWHALIAAVLRERSAFGRNELATTERISLEFGSANPTGPLVVVQGRTLSIGAVLAAALRYCGIPVTTEWIINDAGNQLETFGRSIYARYRQMREPDFALLETGYHGEYVITVAQRLRERDGDRWETVDEAEWLPALAQYGRDEMVADQQRICARFGVTYDLWQSERALHDAGAVSRGIAALTEQGHTYTEDGALWFRATTFGDDKDRVLLRSDGRPTYYAGDVAYHYDKYQRGAASVIDILGPDHHGYIARLKALVAAFGKAGTLDVLIAQQMTLMRGDVPVPMSKRAGNVISLEEVIDEVGVDAARFFFIQTSTDSPLIFDLELAKRTTNDNPVYYVQYGHARIAAVLRNAPTELIAQAEIGASLALLTAPAELALARRLAELPGVIRGVALARAPHRLAKYARDVASDFHQFYAESRILVDDKALSTARLGLALATKSVLATVLDIAGVSAPESM